MLFGFFCKKKREFGYVSVLHSLRGGCYGEGDPRAAEVQCRSLSLCVWEHIDLFEEQITAEASCVLFPGKVC